MKIHFVCLSFCLLALMAATCNKPTPVDPEPEKTDGRKGAPIEVVDGKVRFYVQRESGGIRSKILQDPADFTGCQVRVNSKDYALLKSETGDWYCQVDAVSSDNYSAVLVNARTRNWTGSTAYKDLKLPYAQFASTTAASMESFPQYAEYAAKTGNLLTFTDGFCLLDLTITGSTKLSSVRLRAEGGEKIAGIATYLPSKGQLQISAGVDYIAVNCTGSGAGTTVDGSGCHLLVPVVPVTLSKGLEITLCDMDHKMVRWSSGPLDLKANEVKTLSIAYQPEADLVWYEGFDNFVWGGDVMAGQAGAGFAPDGEKVGIEGGRNRDGYANAFTSVSFDTPGTGFIQSNTWADVSGWTVGESHVMTDAYVRSRNLGDWRYLFRCMEWPGYVSVGMGNTARGIMQTPPIGNLEEMSSVTVSFDFCFQDGMTDDLLFSIIGGGMIRSCTVDGKDNGYEPVYSGVTSSIVLSHLAYSVPASLAAAKTWHHATVEVDRATDGAMFYFAGNDVGAGVHGIWIDNIMVRKQASAGRKGNLRVLYWNIQNGMWSDQANNYNNFVKWVKKYDPDICVWCEAASIYKDNTNQSAPASERFLPDGWASLAARYGHNYTALSGKRDNYPQEITSKYPVKTLLKITDTDVTGKPIAHGAAIQQVEVGGRTINFVTCHMWPQAYGYGVSGDAARAASEAAHEGDYYREYEMQYIVAHTVNDPKYQNDDWLLMGDLNSRSRLDNWYYGYPEDDTRLLTQDVILNETNLVDIIAQTWPGMFCASTYGTARIDYMYASPSMMGRVVDAGILTDQWTSARKSTYVSSFYDPSDHRPILVDFDLTK